MGRNAVRLLHGVRAVRVQVTNLLVKEAGEHGATEFHQDFPWMPMDRSAMLTVWLALADVPAGMGALRFYAGSHRHGLLGRSFTRPDDDQLTQHPWLKELELSPPLDLEAGDATVHHALTVHGAPANRHDRPPPVLHRHLLRRRRPLHRPALRPDRRARPPGQPAVRAREVPVPATVTGPVAELGATLMHEHVFGLSPEILWNWPDIPEGWDLETRAREAAAKLDALKAAGIDTVVDLTVVGLGRYVPAVQRVAELTSVTIVAATGLYTYDALPPYFGNRGPGSLFGGPDRLAEFFVRDLTEGIGRTGVKAAMLKCASDRQGMTDGCRRVFRAVAEAHLTTGAPHHHPLAQRLQGRA
ncbi:phytanoyl-CoA dioxygenase family protein [Nonomuraea salmonea]|uniref:phosphotriesterase family protein n=1 Tax=Nonomuraea salmonea TaxID=46181 RepID=UPI002FEA8487